MVEQCSDQAWLEDCFVHAESEHWVDLCEATLARAELAETFYERLRGKPLIEHLGPLVDRLG